MSTLIGIVGGLTMMFVAMLHTGSILTFIDPPAIMIVFGGTAAAIFISYPFPRVIKLIGVLVQIFKRDIHGFGWVIALMVRLAFKARQKSLLSLEEDMRTIDNRFIQLGLEMIVDGHPAQLIREVLETELDFRQVRHRGGESMFRTAAKYAPAFGLVATLIGLVHMLQVMGADTGEEGGGGVAKLGESMSVALIGTFYGAMAANLFFMPIAEKLKSRTDDEILRDKIIIEGILMLQAGVNPRIIEKKLNSYLPPEHRTAHYDKILKRQKAASPPPQEGG